MQQSSIVKAERLRVSAHPEFDDGWLCERIVEDPSILGVGENLRLSDDEQPTFDAGRIELVLCDPSTEVRFTVIARCGPAEESDVLRAMVRWTMERQRRPDGEHFAILIAESLPPRVLSVAITLGETFPLSTIQFSALRVDEQVLVHFAIVIDRLSSAQQPPEKAPVLEVKHDHDRDGKGHLPLAIDVAPASADPAVFSSNPIAGIGKPPIDRTPDDSALSHPLSFQADGNSTPTPASAAAPIHNRRRRIFSTACAISFLLCAAFATAWVRSYVVHDVRSFTDPSGRQHVFSSDRGGIDWTATTYSLGSSSLALTIPYWLPVGITAILPLAWIGRRKARRRS